MQCTTDDTSISTQPELEFLSPESYVYVALMSVEEGPNKANFIVVRPVLPVVDGAAITATPPSLRTTTASVQTPCPATPARPAHFFHRLSRTP